MDKQKQHVHNSFFFPFLLAKCLIYTKKINTKKIKETSESNISDWKEKYKQKSQKILSSQDNINRLGVR